MPAISDPGEELVRLCGEHGITVSAAPGPSAVITALAMSGLPTQRFTFEGFLSTSNKSRKEHLETLRHEHRTIVLYEAPHKLAETLGDLYDVLGDRDIALGRELTKLHEENVRVATIGDLSILPEETREAFEEAWAKTRDNTGMTLVVAVNYGARQEIMRAVQGCVAHAILEGAEGRDPFEGISEELFERGLYTAGMPDPDLLIRTSGEMRISNFLLWQIAYSEFVCSPVLWPDFDRYEFLRCLLEYQGRDRRFGGVVES